MHMAYKREFIVRRQQAFLPLKIARECSIIGPWADHRWVGPKVSCHSPEWKNAIMLETTPNFEFATYSLKSIQYKINRHARHCGRAHYPTIPPYENLVVRFESTNSLHCYLGHVNNSCRKWKKLGIPGRFHRASLIHTSRCLQSLRKLLDSVTFPGVH
jgi:hypothetical protein